MLSIKLTEHLQFFSLAALSYDRVLTENRLVSHLYHCPFDLNRIEGEACLQVCYGSIQIWRLVGNGIH